MSDSESIWVVSADQPATRGRQRATPLKADELSSNVNQFLEQLSHVLEKTPQNVGKFQFVEFEVHAEVSAQGRLAILGSGVEAGAAGGFKFVFRRLTGSN